MLSTMLQKFVSFLPRGVPLVTLQRSIKTVTTYSGLLVRKLTKTDTAIIDRLNREIYNIGWKNCAEDLWCYLNSFDSSIFIAELDGDLVGSVAFHKYCESYHVVGLFVVLEKYRGKEFGVSLFETTLKDVDRQSTKILAGYPVPEMSTKYEQFLAMHPRWFVTRYAVHVPTAFEVLRAMPSSKGLKVKDLNQVDEGALLSYDASAFGYQRNTFISTWIHSKGNRVKVAVNDNGDIVGYIVARPTYMKQDGYCLRPLFADSTDAAQVLLTALFEDILLDDLTSSRVVYIDCPNINASTRLMKLLNSTPTERHLFSSSKDVPKGQFRKWFGVTSLEFS